MRKNKVIPLQQPRGTSEKPHHNRSGLPWACEMTGQAQLTVQRLHSLAHMMSEMGRSVGKGQTVDAVSIVHSMTLFAEQLEQVTDILDEVRVIIEDIRPVLRAANE